FVGWCYVGNVSYILALQLSIMFNLRSGPTLNLLFLIFSFIPVGSLVRVRIIFDWSLIDQLHIPVQAGWLVSATVDSMIVDGSWVLPSVIPSHIVADVTP
ncbi:hypothetical protein A2U01_0051184, partial [Trifolium medium]|nr:hypothetical protein [Trifolium medium]